MAEAVGAEELAQVLGQITEEVTIRGGRKTLTITPFKAKQFFDVLKCIDRLVDAGVVTLEMPPSGDVNAAIAQLKRELDPRKMIMRGGEQLIRIVAIGARLSVSEAEELDMADLARLTGAVFKTNLDFFWQNQSELKEALGPLWETIRGLIGSDEEEAQQSATDGEISSASLPAETPAS